MARLMSLNVERSKHLDRFIPFMRDYRPDIVCLQELAPADIDAICRGAGLAHRHYVQMAVHPSDDQPFGVGILARHPLTDADFAVYAGQGDGSLTFDRASPEKRLDTCRYAVVRATVAVGAAKFRVGTTHFPWTPDGEPRPFQTRAVETLIAQNRGQPLILTGDFNAPRGGPIFAALSAVWRDCIPPVVTTSIDPGLHRSGGLELMVDGLFAASDYRVEHVSMHTGLSDHQGITATLSPAGRAAPRIGSA